MTELEILEAMASELDVAFLAALPAKRKRYFKKADILQLGYAEPMLSLPADGAGDRQYFTVDQLLIMAGAVLTAIDGSLD